MSAPGFEFSDGFMGRLVQGAPGMLPLVYDVYARSFGAGRPWFVWSKARGNQRCIVDDFGDLVAVWE